MQGGGLPYIYIYMYIYIYIYIYGTPPMYPRLSSKSQLWEGAGAWDALAPTPSSLQNGVGSWARGGGPV